MDIVYIADQGEICRMSEQFRGADASDVEVSEAISPDCAGSY
jgi:hypothetical protein